MRLLGTGLTMILLIGSFSHASHNVETLCQEWNTKMNPTPLVDCSQYSTPLLGYGITATLFLAVPGSYPTGGPPWDAQIEVLNVHGSSVHYKVDWKDTTGNGSGAIHIIGPYLGFRTMSCVLNNLPPGCDANCPTCLDCDTSSNVSDCCAHYMPSCDVCDCEMGPRTGEILDENALNNCNLPANAEQDCDYDPDETAFPPQCVVPRTGTKVVVTTTHVSFDLGDNWMEFGYNITASRVTECLMPLPPL